tara:strand:- start:966 stop:1133 length:168 start_codon:yes stop_codon:yes gene_type:complete
MSDKLIISKDLKELRKKKHIDIALNIVKLLKGQTVEDIRQIIRSVETLVRDNSKL